MCPLQDGSYIKRIGMIMLSNNVRRNFIVNTAAPLMRMGIALVTVPIYLHLIGDARYGVVSIVWALVGYAGFLDFGLSRASANALARIRFEPQAARAEVLVTTMMINLAIGACAGMALFFVSDYVLRYLVEMPTEIQNEVTSALPWIAAMLPATLASGVGVGALESQERFTAANGVQILGVTVGQLLPIAIVVAFGPTLGHVVAGIAIGLLVSATGSVGLAAWQERPLRLGHFRWERAAELFRYGGWVAVSSLINPILSSFDQLLIGRVLGVAPVAHYAVAMNLVLRSQFVPAALSRTIFPRLSQENAASAQALAAHAFVTLAYGYAAIVGPAIIMTPLFFRFWIGQDLAALSAPVAEILFVGAWFNGLAFVPFNLLLGQGRPDLTGKLHFAEVIPFLAVLWLLTGAYGVEGAAVAYTLRTFVDAVSLWRLSGMPASSLSQALAPLGIISVALAASRLLGASTWALAAATVALMATCGLGIYMSPEFRDAIPRMLRLRTPSDKTT